MDLSECLAKGYLERISPDRELAEKEAKEASYDLGKAKKAFEEKDFKWSIVKGYYAMFHIARALLFFSGFREKRHFAIAVALEEISKSGKILPSLVNDFKAGMSAREDADYHYIYSENTAREMLEIANDFCKNIKMAVDS